MATFTIDKGPHKGKEIMIHDNSVHILVGKNGAGKSQMLGALINKMSDAVHLNREFEAVSGISNVVNMGELENEQKKTRNPHQVSSIVAGEPYLRTISELFFQILFDAKLDLDKNNFKIGDFPLSANADGFKSIFNLIYYLISPHKTILMDEPERFLHPSLRSLFISLLSVIAAKYEKKFIIATHSPSLMRFDLDNVFIYQLHNSPSKNEILDLKSWIENLSETNTDERRNKRVFKDWFYYHSDIVFSGKVVLLEGVSDQIILEALRQKLSYNLNAEDLCFKFVACSRHEAGGKSRLHKIHKILNDLVPTTCIADKDIITNGINSWFTPSQNDTDIQVIKKAERNKLYILPRGEIEDYYYIDSGYNYCSSIVNAKRKKIAAAYEQAQIIAQKELSIVSKQFKDVFDILYKIAPQPADIKQYLITIAHNHIMDVFGKNHPHSSHFNIKELADDKVEISFNFIDLKKPIKTSKEFLSKANIQIRSGIEESFKKST